MDLESVENCEISQLGRLTIEVKRRHSVLKLTFTLDFVVTDVKKKSSTLRNGPSTKQSPMKSVVSSLSN